MAQYYFDSKLYHPDTALGMVTMNAGVPHWQVGKIGGTLHV
jgi:hypothetical protein